MYVLGAHRDLARARYRLAEFGDAEAALILAVPSFDVDDLRVHQNEFRVGILFEGDVDDRQPLRNADLGGRQANTVGGIHRLEHVFHQLFQVTVEITDGSSRFLKYRVAKLNDRINHLIVLYLLAVAFEVSERLAHGVAAELFESAARQSQRNHRFCGNACRGHHTDIGTLVGGFDRLSGGEIHRLQGPPQGGNRFQVAAHPDLLAIGNPTFDAARVVPAARKSRVATRSVIGYFIMHRGARGSGRGYAYPNLNRLDGLKRHNSSGEQRVQSLIPLGVGTQPGRNAVSNNFKDATD